ncbi:MAG: hypothetical protein JWN14_4446 [Chthonomonadales bacterium]|nr:hypothetical protein [Chthonomonadales bacterium]
MGTSLYILYLPRASLRATQGFEVKEALLLFFCTVEQG